MLKMNTLGVRRESGWVGIRKIKKSVGWVRIQWLTRKKMKVRWNIAKLQGFCH